MNQFHNYYDMTVTNEKTQESKTYRAYNTATNNIQNISTVPSTIVLGTGSGIPSPSDTGLFHQVYSFGGTRRHLKTYPDPILPILEFSVEGSLAADPSQVWDLTEIGLKGSTLWSHSLFTDKEGKPITIHKSEFDILTFTVHIFVAYNPMFKGENLLFTSEGMATQAASQVGSAMANNAAQSFSYILSPLAEPSWDDRQRHDYYYAFQGGVGIGSGSLDTAPRESKARWGTQDNNTYAWLNQNGMYYNSLLVNFHQAGSFYGYTSGLYMQSLPNSNICAPYALTKMKVGIGDGVNQDFKCPIPMFIKDSDILYVNDIPQRRGIDYTIDNKANQQLNKEIFACCFHTGLTGVYSYRWRTNEPFGVRNDIQGHHAGPWEMTLRADPLIGLDVNAIYYKNLSVSEGAIVTLAYQPLNTTEWIPAHSFTPGTERDKEYLEKFPLIQEQTRWRMTVNTGSISSGFDGQFLFFGYVGEGIHFTDPPEKDATITLTATLDRPYKSSDIVIDTLFTGSHHQVLEENPPSAE